MDLRHIDTCLSSYVLDHCNGERELLLGVYVSSASRVHQVKSDLLSEVSGLMTDKEGFDYDDARAAIVEAFKGAHPLKVWDSRLEKADPEDEDSESCQSWFRLSW